MSAPTDPPPEPPIRVDLTLSAQTLRRRKAVRLFGLAAAAILAAVMVGVYVWRVALVDLPVLPDRSSLWSLNRPPGVAFLDRDGALIGRRGFRHGAPVTLDALPPYVPRAFLAAEDRRFYYHPGVDPIGMARAAFTNLKARRVTQGASTLTQQLARDIFLSPDQTFRRKVQEAVLALELERMLSKDDILTLYLNRTYLGEASYGIEAASQAYFGKSARQLSLSEAALLAALPKAPTRLSENSGLVAALTRSRLVLKRMREEGWITAAEERTAHAHPPVLVPEPRGEGDFGYVFDMAAAEARKLAPAAPDLVVRTTIDSRLQSAAVAALRDGAADAQGRGVTAGALVALAPDGGVVALTGGFDHRQSPFNRAIQARRQPGSAFKPFVYAAAFEKGLGPEDVRLDAPVRYGDYAPANSDGIYRGALTLKEAFAHSVNTVAVRLTHEVGPDKTADLARRFGVGGLPEHPSLPIALGAYEVSLIDMTGAYQVFQRGGILVKPWLVSEVRSARGDILWRKNPQTEIRVYDSALAGRMTGMMRNVIEDPTATGHRARLDRPAAAKTGTSQNNRDAWFIGFTADYVCGVWLGDDADRPMRGEVGGDAPALIWKAFMTAAHQGLPVREFGEDGRYVGGDPRARFYRDLAADFEGAAQGDVTTR